MGRGGRLGRRVGAPAAGPVGAGLVAAVAVAIAVACGPPSRPAEGVEASVAGLGPRPPGWTLTGAQLRLYEVGTDRRVYYSPPASAIIRSHYALGGPLLQPVWAALTQTTAAAPYRGTRLALTASLRVVDVDAPQGVFLRLQVEGPSGAACAPNLLAFDNMYGRRITGSHDWRPYTLVVDVPAQATTITFGVHLNGGGIVWADDFALFAVGPEVPVTDDLALIPNARDALCPGAPTPAPVVLTPVVATPRAAPTAGVGPSALRNLDFDLLPPAPTPSRAPAPTPARRP
jgi:hypothetical protein